MRRFTCLLALAVTVGCTSKQAVDTASDNETKKEDGPFVQTGTVKPGSFFTDVVNYPVPFASPPDLKLECEGGREYAILRQDEYGFTWTAYPKKEDFNDKFLEMRGDLAAHLRLPLTAFTIGYQPHPLKPDVRCADFTWK